MLKIEDLEKTYDGGEVALRGVSLETEGNEIVAIIGPSGAGKSTLVRCVNRLVEPTSGTVTLDGTEITGLSDKELTEARRDMAMIFQEYNLVERLTVMENVLSGRLGYVSFWRAFRRNFPQSDIEAAYDLLEQVGIRENADDRADELSGGQRQRVGVARALIQNPKILLADEPTSSLDPENSQIMMDIITELARDRDIPVLINIHNVDLATEYADRIVGLADGQVVFKGKPSQLSDDDLDEIYSDGTDADQSSPDVPSADEDDEILSDDEVMRTTDRVQSDTSSGTISMSPRRKVRKIAKRIRKRVRVGI